MRGERVNDRPIYPARAARLMKLATTAAVATAAALVAVKLGAWLATESMSVLSSLVDSLMDVFASAINLIAVRHALQPADPEHRFGHGKAEPLAGLGQAAFISGSGVFLIIGSAARIANPQHIENGAIGIAVTIFAIVVTLVLVTFQRYVVRRTKSTAIQADSLHYTSDILVNGGVLVSLVLVMALDWWLADPIIAIGIAGYIIYAAVKIARRSLNFLMDRELPDEEREQIKRIALRHPDVRNMHDLRTRSSGTRAFIQLHLELDGALSLDRAHEISDEVEAEIMGAFPNAEVIIHADPEGLMEKRPSFASH